MIDIKKLRQDYQTDRQAVRKHAEAAGVTVQAVYWHMKRAGISRRTGGDSCKGTQAREMNPNWKGGTTVRKDGYVLEYRDGKQQFQHRVVAESMLGRKLVAGECVHHKNGRKGDNDPNNLEIVQSHAEHMKEHCDSQTMKRRGLKGNAVRWAKMRALKARQP